MQDLVIFAVAGIAGIALAVLIRSMRGMGGSPLRAERNILQKAIFMLEKDPSYEAERQILLPVYQSRLSDVKEAMAEGASIDSAKDPTASDNTTKPNLLQSVESPIDRYDTPYTPQPAMSHTTTPPQPTQPATPETPPETPPTPQPTILQPATPETPPETPPTPQPTTPQPATPETPPETPPTPQPTIPQPATPQLSHPMPDAPAGSKPTDAKDKTPQAVAPPKPSRAPIKKPKRPSPKAVPLTILDDTPPDSKPSAQTDSVGMDEDDTINDLEQIKAEISNTLNRLQRAEEE